MLRRAFRRAFDWLFPESYNNSYWKGRRDGWFALEQMVLERAEEKGYDVQKLWEDLIQ